MAFWLRYTKRMQFLRGLSTFTRTTFTMSLLCFGTVGWFYLFFRPLQVNFQREDADLHALGLRIEKMKKEEKRFYQEFNVKKLEQDYKLFAKRYSDVQHTVDFIFSLLREFRLTCKAFQPVYYKAQQVAHSADFYLCIKGSFKIILSFLIRLEKSDYLISFEKFSLQHDKKRTLMLNALIRIPSFKT